MTTFLSIHRTEAGAITLDLDTSLFSQPELKAPKVAPKAIQPKAVQPTKVQPKAASKPKASKPKAAKRTKRPSEKPTYDAIRKLTAEGRHDEAIVIAQSKDWGHVVESIESHRAKHGVVAVKPEPKAPAKPKASTAKRTRRANGTFQPKAVVKAAAPVKASPVKAEPVPTKAQARKAANGSKKLAGNKAQAFPKGYQSEADLVLHWASCKAAGHVDILRTAMQASNVAFTKAAIDGDKRQVNVIAGRIRNLKNLLAS